MRSPVRVVVFGNSFAAKVQLPALARLEEAQVVGLAGRDEEKARATAERFGISASTGHWPDLLDLEPDLVLVSTPVDLHFDMVSSALEMGAAVLCEKPFTLDVDQAEDLANLAQGRLALVDHQLRWNPNRRKLRQLVQEGFVGEVYHVRSDLVLDSPTFLSRPHGWWFEEARGGGVLGALGSHMVDDLLWTFGPIEAVRGRLETFVKERPDTGGTPRPVTADDHAELWLRAAGGAAISLTCSVSAPGASRWLTEVAGSEGTLRIDLEDDLVGGRHGEDMRSIEVDGELADPAAHGIEATGPFAACEPLFLADVVDCVARGASELPGAATFEDGLACMRVLEAARRSSKSGDWVDCR